ncbi:MAG: FkbM family methyltransferase [Hyphomicrobiales bacterium]
MSIQSLFTKKPPSKEPDSAPESGIIKDILRRLQELQDRKPGGQSAYLGDHTAICRTVFGHKIYIDTRDISLAPHLAMDGIWEMWITEAMSRLLRPGMACVDLGTNFGWYSLLMADRIGPKGHLIGADANSRMVDLCRKSMSVNGFLDRSHIHHAAITDRIGDVTFSALESYMGSGSLKDMGDTATQFHDRTVTMTVPGQTLDALIKGRAIDFMKIDCEGAEPRIIRGALETLKSPDLQIFMEYAPGFYAPGEVATMIGTLADAGFSFFSIDTQSRFEPMSRDALLNLAGLSELYLKRGKL